ncbi:MAG: histidine--tRNA ligase [Candidatus Colwellbacteria bacterium CG10_big_fil_rev_8_21_14_0_10_41_28]|uniref:Histidine--tRNA ligase n=1 Tax=Candidatus Colwellbacteria bacterium CG10_big_fil_rev_8_21_14_0_10_41_28 TaxID=1974539 RepID=A0A2H0VJ97_9BACT|nr:MAG: histidine--tRNA ligase [Candidatus Colwellbacteria bacterium CG10_big_fil_rev_8_21_14_0_10_41_28]
MPDKKTIKAIKKTSKKKFDLQVPKGMRDVFAEGVLRKEKLYKVGRDIFEFYGFEQIETPILEKEELFVRSVGSETDIVQKEMYAIKGGGSNKLVLRPEMTASVMRSYLENGMRKLPQPRRLYYRGPMFRKERPQAGRFRQFDQIGVEIVGGESDPIYDAQVILIFYKMLESLKLENIVVGVNSIGSDSDRQNYKKKLVDHYKKNEKKICPDCKRRLKTNPLRVLDCKVKECQPIKDDAPIILDNLTSVTKAHFKEVLEYLEELNVPYTLTPHLVRGLDYYSRTVFEIYQLGEESEPGLTLVAGGRYDYLANVLGSKGVSGIGAAMGVDRVIEAVLEKDVNFGLPRKKDLAFLVHVGQLAKKKSMGLLEELRGANINIVSNLGKTSLSSQLEKANKVGASIAIILGQKEVYEDNVILRNMKTGTQEDVPRNKLIKQLKKRLK